MRYKAIQRVDGINARSVPALFAWILSSTAMVSAARAAPSAKSKPGGLNNLFVEIFFRLGSKFRQN
jgi:hypothetical protein